MVSSKDHSCPSHASARKVYQPVDDELLRQPKLEDTECILVHTLPYRHLPVSSSVKAHADCYCPVLRFPPEIVAEIFKHYLTPTKPEPASQSTTPFHLGHICRTWREFVWSSPRLWKVVWLQLDIHFRTNLLLVEEWVSRSGCEPLSIQFTWKASVSDAEAERERQRKIYSELLSIFLRSLRRWQNVDFRIPGNLYGFDVFQARVRFPRLTRVSVYDLPALQGTLTTMLCNAPNLTEIYCFNCRIQNYILPLHQLTRVSLRKCTLDECLFMLSGCPRLTCCTFTDATRQVVTVENPVTAPHLRSLTLSVDSGVLLSQFLGCLKTPIVCELAITSEFSTILFESISSLLVRSSCVGSLQCLLLVGVFIQGEELFACLELTPNIIELRLSSWHLRSELVTLLNPYYVRSLPSPRGPGPLLPKLQVLEYEGRPDIRSQDVKNMLLSRWHQGTKGNVAQLRQVYLGLIPDTSEAPPVVGFPLHYRIAGTHLHVGITQKLYEGDD